MTNLTEFVQKSLNMPKIENLSDRAVWQGKFIVLNFPLALSIYPFW